MYKVLKCLPIVFFIIAMVLFNCDGRYRMQKTNLEVLAENDLLKSFSKTFSVIPKSYTEIETDTLLSNNFRVKMNYHSLPNDIIESYTNEHGRIHYSNFEAFINVSFEELEVFNGILDKSVFSRLDKAFVDGCIMQYIWVDYGACTQDRVGLKVSLAEPNTSSYKDFSIQIFKNGKIEITEINLLKRTA